MKYRVAGKILTNDNFNNHVRQGHVSRQWLDDRLVKYMWVKEPGYEDRFVSQ